MHTAVLALRGAHASVDTDWPPVLVIFVLALVGAGVVSIVVVLRKVRAGARPSGRGGAR